MFVVALSPLWISSSTCKPRTPDLQKDAGFITCGWHHIYTNASCRRLTLCIHVASAYGL